MILALLLLSPLDLFGFTPRGTAMAGAMTAADGLPAAFYNPAAMFTEQKTSLAFGLADTIPALHIRRDLPSSPVESAMPEAAPSLQLGAIVPVASRVRVGAALSFPTNRLLRLENLDSSKPQFLLYQSKPQRFSVSVNAAVRLTSWLGIGGGVGVGQSESGAYRFGLDVPDRLVTVREAHVDATFAPSYAVGLLAQPSAAWRIGLVWRGEEAIRTDVPTIFELQSLGTLQIQTAGTALYYPHVLSLGFSYSGAVRVSAQVDAQLWSQAPSEEVQFAILPTGQVLTDTGLGDLLGYDAPPQPAGFRTVLVPRAAVEWGGPSALTLRAGAAFKPAVTPDQIALTSYLDNPTLQLGAGASRDFGGGVSVDAAVAATVLFERTMTKASAANPTGNASFGGALWSGSAMVHYVY
ncbi:MAG: OmpP1/FadL family transporter [Myxococcales bacterium]